MSEKPDAGFGHSATAQRFNKVVTKLVKKIINTERPDLRIGRVYDYNRVNQTAYILFPGNDIQSLVPVHFALDKIPSNRMATSYATDGMNAFGDIVRIAGKPGQWFILDYVSGAPKSDYTDQQPSADVIQFIEETFVITRSGTQTFDLQYGPVAGSMEVFWNTLYQPMSEWAVVGGLTFALNDPTNFLVPADKITVRYSYRTDNVVKPLPANPPFVGATAMNGVPVDGGVNKMDIPTATKAGDLIVFACSAPNAVVTDARFNQHYGPVWVGYATGDGNIPITFTANQGFLNWTTAVTAVYRNVVVADSAGTNQGNPSSAAVVANSTFALVAGIAGDGVVAGTTMFETTGAWINDVVINNVKSYSFVFHWNSDIKGPTPAGVFTSNGSYGGGTFLTLRLESTK